MTEDTHRDASLRALLIERRRAMQLDVQHRLRAGRLDRQTNAGDVIDRSDADNQSEADLALLQMHTASLIRLDDAILRLDAGQYGCCVACRSAISERRLRALPLAARCQPCEEQRELAASRVLPRDHGRGALWLVPAPSA